MVFPKLVVKPKLFFGEGGGGEEWVDFLFSFLSLTLIR